MHYAQRLQLGWLLAIPVLCCFTVTLRAEPTVSVVSPLYSASLEQAVESMDSQLRASAPASAADDAEEEALTDYCTFRIDENYTDAECFETDKYCDVTNALCVSTDRECNATDAECYFTEHQCTLTDFFCYETDAACHATNEECDITNHECGWTDGSACALTEPECNSTDSVCNVTEAACNPDCADATTDDYCAPLASKQGSVSERSVPTESGGNLPTPLACLAVLGLGLGLRKRS